MPTDLLKRLAEVSAELERQNAAWERVQRALAGLGVNALPVPRWFFEELDALAHSAVPRPRGLRA
jgi:hypothetical protein